MADPQPFVTKKDLEEVTQKVAIHNSKDITKPLVDQQKNNDLKELERSIEQKALFQDIADGIRGLGDSLLKGLKGLIPKTDGGLSKILGLGFGLLLAPFVVFINFIRQLGREINFLTKGRAAKWLANFKLRFTTFFSDIFKRIKNSKLGKFVTGIMGKIKLFFTGIFDKLKNSKLGKFVTGIVNKLKNSKILKSISSLFKKVFGGKGGFFGKLGGIFSKIVKFATGGPFKMIMGFAKNLGRILGKVFLPITIIMGIFDFVKGFMRGYEEGGIIEGIKQGIMDLFDGLVGSLLRMLTWIPSKIAEWLGLKKFSKAISAHTETFIQSIKDVFGGLVDVIVGIFTWDTNKMKKGFSKIWEGIVNVVKSSFTTLFALIEDLFDIDMDDILKPIGEAFDDMTSWFSDMGDALADFFTWENAKKLLSQLKPDWMKSGEEDDARSRMNLSPRQLRALQDVGGGIPRGGGPLPSGGTRVANNNNSATVINNNTFNAPSNNGIAAMQRAMG